MSGVSGDEIKKFIIKHGGADMSKEFLGIFAVDELKNLTKFRSKIASRKHSVPFCISNTDPIELPGEHWIGILNICPNDHLFIGFSTFIKSDDEEIIGSFFDEEDDDDEKYYDGFSNSIGYKNIHFKAKEYDKGMNNNLKKKLIPACQGLLELFVEYAKANQNEEITCHFLRDQLQETDTYWCGIFLLYLLYNLFNPLARRLSNKSTTCTMRHIKMVMEELFNPATNEGRRMNSILLQNFVKDYNIKGTF